MKRSWMGFALLLVLLLGGIFVTYGMIQIHVPMETDLNQAAECALLNDWDNAARYFRSARDRWDKWEVFRLCFADHTPVEEVNAGFAMLEIYCGSQDSVAFAAAACQLANQTAAVGEAHGFSFGNIF